MSLWTITLLIGYALVLVINLICSFTLTTLWMFIMCAAIIMLPGALFLFVGRILPKGWFSPNKAVFKDNRFKQWVCRATNVKAWKDKIPVGGKVAGFKLSKLSQPKNVAFLDRFIYESCFADYLHTSLAIWGLIAVVIIAFINTTVMLSMALPLAILFFYQNICSSIIQWFVRPRIIRLKEIAIKRQKESADETEPEPIAQ